MTARRLTAAYGALTAAVIALVAFAPGSPYYAEGGLATAIVVGILLVEGIRRGSGLARGLAAFFALVGVVAGLIGVVEGWKYAAVAIISALMLAVLWRR